jgi:hypothetical protein
MKKIKDQLTNTTCKQFVANIVDKNYSDANSTLQKMIEIKLSERIRSSLAEKNKQ